MTTAPKTVFDVYYVNELIEWESYDFWHGALYRSFYGVESDFRDFYEPH